jgi:hypothetical protein
MAVHSIGGVRMPIPVSMSADPDGGPEGAKGDFGRHFHFPALTFDTASKNPLAPMCAVRLV